jgi:succinate dehydrogenase/fumarate reductase cytochrome b subunit
MKENATLRTLFELSGVVPLTLYALIHVASYAAALFGAREFGTSGGGAGAVILEVLLIWLPLLFHSGYALWRAKAPLPTEASDRRRLLGAHLSGGATLAFLLGHTLWLRLPLWRGERAPEDVRQMLAAGLSATSAGVPVIAALHLVGIAAIAAHIDGGLRRFADHFGLLRERAARRVARTLSLTLFAVGAVTVVHFATGSALPSFVR